MTVPVLTEQVLSRVSESPNFNDSLVYPLAGNRGVDQLAVLTTGPIPFPVTVDGQKVEWVKRLEGLRGKGACILTDRVRPLNDVQITDTGEEFSLPPVAEQIRQEIAAKLAGQANYRDEPRWSPVQVVDSVDGCTIPVSRSRYSDLVVARNLTPEQVHTKLEADFSQLANLLTVYSITETSDGYLMLALRDGKFNDQSDGTCVAVGFMPRSPDLTVKETLDQRCDEEIAVVGPQGKETVAHTSELVDSERALHLGLAYSLSGVWDVTNHAYLPLNATADQIAIPLTDKNDGHGWRGKHRLMFFVPNSQEAITSIIAEGGVRIDSKWLAEPGDQVPEGESVVVPMAGLVLSSLYKYAKAREQGLIVPTTARTDTEIIVSDKKLKREAQA